MTGYETFGEHVFVAAFLALTMYTIALSIPEGLFKKKK